jgi:hypothetical protein
MLPGTMRCPYCGMGNPAAAMYCAGCGNILRGMETAESQTFITGPGERNTTTGQFAPAATFMSSPSAPTYPVSAPMMAPPPPDYSQTPPPYNAPLPPPGYPQAPGHPQFYEPVTGQPPQRVGARPGRLVIVALLLVGIIVMGGGGALALSHFAGSQKPHPSQGGSPFTSSGTGTAAATSTPAMAPSPTAAPTQKPTPTPTAKPAQAPTAMTTPASSGYPTLASVYKGTANNTTANRSSGITLSSMKEGPQGKFTGYLTVAPPLAGSGPITGTVSKTGAIQFTSQPTDGSVPINWYGTIQPNGSMSGTYVVPDYQQKGTWQASPV